MIFLYIKLPIVLLVLGIKIINTEGQSGGFLRFCSNGETFRADATTCRGGYFLKKSTVPQCICAHGVWVLSKSFCDPNFAVIIGVHGSCFSLNSEVRWIRMIGNTDNPYSSYYFTSNINFDRVETASAVSGSSSFHSQSVLVGSINPDRPVEDTDGTVCVRPHKIAVLPAKNSNNIRYQDDYDYIKETRADLFNFVTVKTAKEKWSFRQVQECSPYSDEYSYSDTVGAKQFFQYDIAMNSSIVNTTCNATCVADNEWISPNENTSTNITYLSGDNLKEDYPTSLESEDLKKSRDASCAELLQKTSQIPLKTETQLKEQTKRAVLTQVNFALFKHKGPSINYTEYKMFQKGRRVLEKTCPGDEVPKEILRGVGRMFRHVLNESLENFPYRASGDAAENERILGAIKKCFEEPTEGAIKFSYDNATCPPQFTTISYTFKSGSTVPLRNLSSHVPCGLQFNSDKYDFIVEVGWKIVLFTHYFCSRHFAAFGFEHSHYVEKMTEFFNRDLLQRWRHTEKSFDALQYVFKGTDLDKFSVGLDRCVGAARSLSQYRKWIKRPKFYQLCGQKVAVNTWNGRAVCLNNWKDPLQLFTGFAQEAKTNCAEQSEFWNEKEEKSHE